MKKTVSSVLAILLVLALALGLAGCGGKENDPTQTSTEAPTETEYDPNAGFDPSETLAPNTEDISAGATVDPTATVDPSVSVDPSATTLPGTTVPGGTTTAPVTGGGATTQPPVNAKPTYDNQLPLWKSGAAVDPTKYDDSLLLRYFNWCANNVREKKPAFKASDRLWMEDIKPSVGGSVIENAVNDLVKDLMPGAWEEKEVKKGEANSGSWMTAAENWAVALTPNDISNISVKKSGSNYVISVKLPSETNPNKTPGNSKYSKLHEIEDRAGVLKSITDSLSIISADPSNATLVYRDGYSNVTVNAKSQVIAMDGGFDVDAVAKKVKITVIGLDLTAKQYTRVKAENFSW